MKYICPVCIKSVRENCRSIQCDICKLWIHQSKCSGLSLKQFEVFSLPNSDNWYCPSCFNSALPFPPDSDQCSSNISPDSILNDELKTLLANLNNAVASLATSNDDEDELEIKFHSNSCSYLNCDEFNSIVSKTPTNFSAFHLNIASMPKHYDELITLLAQLDCKFSFIGISETRNTTIHAPELDHEYCIPGYNKFSTPAESSAGGVSLYISDIFSSICLLYTSPSPRDS